MNKSNRVFKLSPAEFTVDLVFTWQLGIATFVATLVCLVCLVCLIGSRSLDITSETNTETAKNKLEVHA